MIHYEVVDDDDDNDIDDDDNDDDDDDDGNGNNNVTMFDRVMGSKYSLLSSILALYRLSP